LKLPAWIVLPAHPHGAAPGNGPVEDDGVQGNRRLTSATGMVLLAALAVEGVTILSVRQMITLHIFVGVLLLGPVLLKTGSTIYRFGRYYRGTPAYRRNGPPHPLPRILGPFLILSSLALLGTGITVMFLQPDAADWWVTAHQTCFWIWLALLAVHLLGHLWEAAIISWTELRSSLTGTAGRNRRWRYAIIVAALVVGVGAATILVPSATAWTNRQERPHFGPPGFQP
jgi:hypothetical protein